LLFGNVRFREDRNFRIAGDSTTTREQCNNFAEMAYEGWTLATATIKSCAWENPPSQSPSSLFVGHFTVAFSFVVDRNRYSGKFYSSREWEKETEVPILYNPQNPVESCVCDEEESSIIPVFECALELLGGLILG